MIDFKEKKVLMIHAFKQEYFKLPLEDYILSFDDGLYSQYLHIDKLLQLDTKLIFNISTNVICPENVKQNDELISADIAHKKAFKEKKFENFLKWSQIKKIFNSGGIISGHSHNHYNMNTITNVIARINLIKQDTKEMLLEFKKNLSYTPEIFCFPYNFEPIGYKIVLTNDFGFKYFLGKERVDISTL